MTQEQNEPKRTPEGTGAEPDTTGSEGPGREDAADAADATSRVEDDEDGVDLSDLDGLDTLDLDAPTAPPTPDVRAPGPSIKVRGPTGAFVKMQAARLEWQLTVDKVSRALGETAEGVRGDFDDDEAAQAVLRRLGTRAEELQDALDLLLETPAPDPSHAGTKAAALKVLDAYVSEVKADPVLKVLDRSPYTSTQVGKLLTDRLAAVRAHLS